MRKDKHIRIFSTISFHLALVIAWGICLLFPGMHKPFNGKHEFNGVEYGVFGRNIARFGIIKTKGGQLTESGPTIPLTNKSYNTHHLPLLPHLLALSYRLFGVNEATTRFPIIVISLSSLVLTYLIGREICTPLMGMAAAFLMGITPLFRYYGKLPVHEPILLLELLFLLFTFIRYIHTQHPVYFRWLLLMTLFIGFTGWPGYFFIPGLIVFSFFFIKPFPKKLLFLPLILVLTVSLHLWHVKVLSGSFTGGGLKDVLMLRLNLSNSQTAKNIQFSWQNYHQRFQRMQKELITPSILFLTYIWLGLMPIMLMLSNIWSKNFFRASLWISAIFFMSLGYPLVFAPAVYIHEYLWMYALPFFTLGAAYALHMLDTLLSTKGFITILVTVIIVLSSLQSDRNYYRILQDEGQDNIRITLGRLIQATTDKNAMVLLCPAGSLDQYTFFYADRDIQEDTSCTSKDIENGTYDYVVLDRVANKELYTYALTRYPLIASTPYTIFKLSASEDGAL